MKFARETSLAAYPKKLRQSSQRTTSTTSTSSLLTFASQVSDRRIWAAALAGIKAFEAEGVELIHLGKSEKVAGFPQLYAGHPILLQYYVQYVYMIWMICIDKERDREYGDTLGDNTCMLWWSLHVLVIIACYHDNCMFCCWLFVMMICALVCVCVCELFLHTVWLYTAYTLHCKFISFCCYRQA